MFTSETLLDATSYWDVKRGNKMPGATKKTHAASHIRKSPK
jgi:hypothetical protein